MSARLLPPVVPSVAIQTSTFDAGVGLVTGMLLCPGCIGVGALSAVVSSSWAGVVSLRRCKRVRT